MRYETGWQRRLDEVFFLFFFFFFLFFFGLLFWIVYD